jgi:hypothetical protein
LAGAAHVDADLADGALDAVAGIVEADTGAADLGQGAGDAGTEIIGTPSPEARLTRRASHGPTEVVDAGTVYTDLVKAACHRCARGDAHPVPTKRPVGALDVQAGIGFTNVVTTPFSFGTAAGEAVVEDAVPIDADEASVADHLGTAVQALTRGAVAVGSVLTGLGFAG